MANPHDGSLLKKYNSHKQSSKRVFGHKNAASLKQALESGNGDIWSIMKNFQPRSNIEPDRDLLYDHINSAVKKL